MNNYERQDYNSFSGNGNGSNSTGELIVTSAVGTVIGVAAVAIGAKLYIDYKLDQIGLGSKDIRGAFGEGFDQGVAEMKQRFNDSRKKTIPEMTDGE